MIGFCSVGYGNNFRSASEFAANDVSSRATFQMTGVRQTMFPVATCVASSCFQENTKIFIIFVKSSDACTHARWRPLLAKCLGHCSTFFSLLFQGSTGYCTFRLHGFSALIAMPSVVLNAIRVFAGLWLFHPLRWRGPGVLMLLFPAMELCLPYLALQLFHWWFTVGSNSQSLDIN